MALQVWLPLNGDTRNYGCSNVNGVYTQPGGFSYENGKIGKCLRIANGGSNALTYSGLVGLTTWSICCWMKLSSSDPTPSYQDMFSLGIDNNGATSGAGFRFEHRNISGTLQIVTTKLTTYGSTTNSYYTFYGDNTNLSNLWAHVVVTNDGTNYKTYVNGILKNTTAINLFTATTSKLTGELSLGQANTYCWLNDIRVYDEALSEKEIKEISKALIVHYPMNGGGKGLPNYLVNSNFYNKTNSWGGVNGSSVSVVKKDGRNTITATKGTSNMLICQNMSTYSYTKNTTITFTISADVYTEVEGTLNVGNWITTTEASGWQGMNLTEIWNTPNTLHVGWNHISVTHKNASKQYTGTIITGFGYTGTTCYFTNIKFEFSDKETPWMPYTGDAIYNKYVGSIAKEYDTSGFGNHGTVVGSLELTSDTPRYNIATLFQKAGYLDNPNFKMDLYAFTLTFWVNFQTPTSQHFLFGTFDSWTSNGIGIWRDTATPLKYTFLIRSNTASSYTTSAMTVSALNIWNFMVISYDGTLFKGYLNGVLQFSVTYGGNGYVINKNLMVGNSKYNSTPASENEECILSDFRIYATALSDADILELYKTSASIDDKGNLLTYEIVEG